MAFQPIQHCSLVEVRYSHDTNQMENTFAYYWADPPPSAAELDALCAAVAGDLAFYMRRTQITGCVYREVHARNMHTSSAAQGNYTFPGGVTGQRGGNPVADSEASGITKRTGFTGRSNRGRNSISGFAEADVDGNSIGNTLMTLLADVAVHVLADYVGGRFTAAVGSRHNNIAIPLLSAAVLDNNIDSQKTRLNTHGT